MSVEKTQGGRMRPLQDPGVLPSGSSVGDFDDEIIRQTMAEDPLVAFLGKHWKNILIVAIVAGAAWFAFYQFQNAAEERTKLAADSYFKVRDSYAGLLSTIETRESEKDEKKRAELTAKIENESTILTEAIRALGDTRPPYSGVASLYRNLHSIATSPDRSSLSLPNWKAEPVGSPQRLVAELEALAVARALLDGNPETAARGSETLRELAREGTVVYATAAVTVAHLAESDEEKVAAKSILDEVMSKHPDQAEVIEPAQKRLN